MKYLIKGVDNMTDKELQKLRTKIKAEIETAKKSKDFSLVIQLLKEEAALVNTRANEMLNSMM